MKKILTILFILTAPEPAVIDVKETELRDLLLLAAFKLFNAAFISMASNSSDLLIGICTL